jgi:signal transduction histidine kinase
MVTISLGSVRLGRLADRFPPAPPAPPHVVMVTVPHASLAAAWLALLPRLLISGVLALVASLPVALWLTRSITRPLARITRASEEMARGNYEQQIPVERQDEIGRLATAFNLMAKQVALSHRTLREFLADVSHELRTPLTSIRGFSQAMTDGTLRTPADYADAGQVIHEEAERMARLVEDLLYLSRVESGQFASERHPLDLGALVAGCVQRAERRAAAREVLLTYAGERVPPVLGEPHRLEQVVYNLLDNALKHTPAGGEIHVRLGSDSNGGVRLGVHNSGSFIPPAEQGRVFDRFYRGHSNRNSEGTGLGLSIARQIVETHGGRIAVASTAEGGTEFTVWLPASKGSVASAVEPLDLSPDPPRAEVSSVGPSTRAS